MVQGNYGNNGNYELVFPCSKGGFCYYSGNNDNLTRTDWHGPLCIGKGKISGIAMIQGNYGTKGNLEVIAVEDKELVHYWRADTGSAMKWHGPFRITGKVKGTPSLVQMGSGVFADFKVVVPCRNGGGMWFLTRNNGRNGGFEWSEPVRVGNGKISGCAMLRTTVGNINSTLEVVAVEEGILKHYKLYEGNDVWESPVTIGIGYRGSPGFIQATIGSKTIFELIAPCISGGLTHFRRKYNAANTLPWVEGETFGNSKYHAVSLVQKHEGNDNLDVVVTKARGGEEHYIYKLRASTNWEGPHIIPRLARLRLHTKILTSPPYIVHPEGIVNAAIDIFYQIGIHIELISTEYLSLPELSVLNIASDNGEICDPRNLNPEIIQLFEHRNNVSGNDIVAYFIDSTMPRNIESIPATVLGGCASYPEGKPGFFITRGMNEYVFIHELCHVLGLNHNSRRDNIMNEFYGALNPNPEFRITRMQISKILKSGYVTTSCC